MTVAEWWAVFDLKRQDQDRVDKRLTKRQAKDLTDWCAQKDREDTLLGVAKNGVNR